VTEARRLEAAGIDVIVAQGFEAGGHRGAFAAEPDECLSTFTLLPRIVGAVNVPVLAAGGIATGAGIAAALALGAAGAQLGTVFIDCPESAAGEAYRRALRADEMTTAMTAVFSGRRGRGIVNRFVRELGDREREVPDYPVAYDAGKRLAAAATAAGSHEFTAMWAGQGPQREAALPATELVGRLGEELAATLRPTASGTRSAAHSSPPRAPAGSSGRRRRGSPSGKGPAGSR
jgi:nitronate monooxygenase